MKEILLNNGFIDKGICGICGGTAWNYEKIVNGRLIQVKVRIKNAPTGPVEQGHCNIYRGQTLVARAQKENLLNVLKHNGFAETVQA